MNIYEYGLNLSPVTVIRLTGPSLDIGQLLQWGQVDSSTYYGPTTTDTTNKAVALISL